LTIIIGNFNLNSVKKRVSNSKFRILKTIAFFGICQLNLIQTGFAEEGLDFGDEFGSAPTADTSSTPTRTSCPTHELNELISNDLDKQPAQTKSTTRYFSFFHLECQGLTQTQLKLNADALRKLVNSLHWNPEMVNLVPINDSKTVFRFQLKDAKTHTQSSWGYNEWQTILNRYPYQNYYLNSELKSISAKTLFQNPVIRGDWFLANGSTGVLYDALLGIPDNVHALESRLGVGRESAIQLGKAKRAGFSQSGVSINNRMIERHPTRFGAYWISYDFAAPTTQLAGSSVITVDEFKDLGSHPIDFKQDGGEVIFNLPNGMQGYMLIDSKGQKIQEGPIGIVKDPLRPNSAVKNAVSCMRCHHEGIIEKEDTIRNIVTQNQGRYSDQDLKLVKKLYIEHPEMTTLMRQDQQRMKTALTKLGITSSEDPLFDSASKYEKDVTLPMAASELGLTPSQITELINTNSNVGNLLRSLSDGLSGTDRGVFEATVKQTNADALVPISATTQCGPTQTPISETLSTIATLICDDIIPRALHKSTRADCKTQTICSDINTPSTPGKFIESTCRNHTSTKSELRICISESLKKIPQRTTQLDAQSISTKCARANFSNPDESLNCFVKELNQPK
jgi:hypothetical protein